MIKSTKGSAGIHDGLEVEVMIFDLDGTLIDSKSDIAHAVNSTLSCFGMEPVPLAEVEKFVGTGVTPLILQKVGALNPALADQAIVTFEDIYASALLKSTTTYPGVIDVLEHFKAKTKVVLTNKRTRFVDPILSGLGIRRYFSATFGAESLPARKPDPQTVFEICKRLGAAVENTVIIGDTETDIVTGQAAGCLTCAVSYGYGDVSKLRSLSPDIFVDDVRAIVEVLN